MITLEETMEQYIIDKVEAIKFAVVSSRGQIHSACLLTLNCDNDNPDKLTQTAMRFAERHGSSATTVEEARKCNNFRRALLNIFAACNREMVSKYKTSMIRPAQLRRFTILTEQFSLQNGTLLDEKRVNRQKVFEMFSDVFDTMFDAVFEERGHDECRHGPAERRVEAPRLSDDDSEGSSERTEQQDPCRDVETSMNLMMDSPIGNLSSSGQLQTPRELGIFVHSREPRPNVFRRWVSNIKLYFTCCGPHSQALDDDILNPGHAVVKRAAPGKQTQQNAGNDEKQAQAEKKFDSAAPFESIDWKNETTEEERAAPKAPSFNVPTNYPVASPPKVSLPPLDPLTTDFYSKSFYDTPPSPLAISPYEKMLLHDPKLLARSNASRRLILANETVIANVFNPPPHQLFASKFSDISAFPVTYV